MRTRGASGAIVIDGVQVAETRQCVHCGSHWMPEPGSGIIRGFCRRCMGPICSAACAECRPFEKWLEEMERA